MDNPSENSPENDGSGIGVIDKATLVMSALESGPATLAQPVSTMHLARPTIHRVVVALESHRLVTRDSQGRSILGPRLTELASATGEDHLPSAAGPVLAALRDKAHESAQLHRCQGGVRICVVNAERLIGLRDSIPVGVTMSMQDDSAAQVLLAWEEPDHPYWDLVGARFTTTMPSAARRWGWAQPVGECEPGVAFVLAPVRGPEGKVVVAISISEPIERVGCQSDRVYRHVVVVATRRLSEVLTDTGTV